MNVFNRFGARTIFFAFVAIFCALAISEGTEAEYYDKSSIWTGDMDGTIVDSNGMEKGYNFHSYSERFLDVSSDGRHFAVGGSTTEYLSDEDEVRTGYHILGNYNYNRSIPANVFHECIIGNDYYWGGDCSSISVKISGDGKYIAAIISERPNCRNQGIYDEVDNYNATGPCKDYYREEQKEQGWPEGGYSGYRNTLKLVIYDRLSGNLVGEYVFCYNNGYNRDSYEYIYCQALAQSWETSKLKISDDGESVIVAFQNVYCYACGDDGGVKYINELFGFTVSDINDGPDWHYIYSDRLYEVDIGNDGDTVVAALGEYVKYYNKGSLEWTSHLFGDVQNIDMSGDGSKIVAETEYMMIYCLSGNSPEPLWEYAHYQPIYEVKISSEGNNILISSSSGLIYFLYSSNSPLWMSDGQINYGNYISLSYNGLRIFANEYLINSVNGNTVWKTSGRDGGFISDNGNIVFTTGNGFSLFTVDSQIFYPVAIAGEDTTKKTSQIVQFTGQGTDVDGTITKYEWDFDGNGVYDWYNHANGLYTYYYNNEGVYTATLRVTDSDGLTSTDTVTITISGVSTGELIDPKDDDEIDQEEESGSGGVNNTEENEKIETPNVSKDDEEDEGFLPSIGFITAIGIISIIGLMRRYS